MTFAESVNASLEMFVLKFFNNSGWFTVSIALAIKAFFASASFTYSAAFLFTKARAFLV